LEVSVPLDPKVIKVFKELRVIKEKKVKKEIEVFREFLELLDLQ
jgi:hypothetical protein